MTLYRINICVIKKVVENLEANTVEEAEKLILTDLVNYEDWDEIQTTIDVEEAD